MADQIKGIEILLKAILDSKGFDDLKARLQESIEKTKQHADADDDASKHAQDFEEALHKVGEQLLERTAELLAGREALNFFREAIKEAIEDEKELYQFNAINQSIGKSTAANREENEKWLLSLQQSSGILKGELIPAYMKLVAETGNVEQAMAATQVAAGAAAQGLGGVGENATLLARYLLNPDGPIRGTSAFAIQLKTMQKEGKSSAEVMKALSEKFSDAGASVNTSAQQVARAKIEWTEFKEGVGGLALALVQYLKPALEIVAVLITGVIVGAQKFGGYVGVIFSEFGGFLNAMGALLRGELGLAKKYFTDTVRDMKSGFKEVGETGDKTAEKLLSSFNRGTEGLLGAKKVTEQLGEAAKKHAKELEKPIEMYQRLAAAAEANAEGEFAAALAVSKVWRQAADDARLSALQRAEADKKSVDSARAAAKAKMDADAAVASTENKYLADWLKGENDRKKRFQQQVDQELKLKIQTFQKLKKMDADYGKYVAGLLEQESNDFEISEEKKTQYAEKAAEIRKQVREQELRQEEAVANAAIGFLNDAFGASKSIAVANAVIHTYEGAAKALADYAYPYSVIVAALVIASGIAQIAKIESTEPASTGKGFDDPSNDFGAYLGGQKWARDMVDQYSAGAAAGFHSQMTTNDNRQYNTTKQGNRTVHNKFELHGLIDSANSASMRKLIRTLQVATTLENQRTPR